MKSAAFSQLVHWATPASHCRYLNSAQDEAVLSDNADAHRHKSGRCQQQQSLITLHSGSVKQTGLFINPTEFLVVASFNTVTPSPTLTSCWAPSHFMMRVAVPCGFHKYVNEAVDTKCLKLWVYCICNKNEHDLLGPAYYTITVYSSWFHNHIK